MIFMYRNAINNSHGSTTNILDQQSNGNLQKQYQQHKQTIHTTQQWTVVAYEETLPYSSVHNKHRYKHEYYKNGKGL